MNLAKLKTELAKSFPKVWIKDGDDFDTNHKKTLWTGEGSEIDVTVDGETYEIAAFNMYGGNNYTCGVVNELHKFLHKRGFFAEAYDSGTFFIYKA